MSDALTGLLAQSLGISFDPLGWIQDLHNKIQPFTSSTLNPLSHPVPALQCPPDAALLAHPTKPWVLVLTKRQRYLENMPFRCPLYIQGFRYTGVLRSGIGRPTIRLSVLSSPLR